MQISPKHIFTSNNKHRSRRLIHIRPKTQFHQHQNFSFTPPSNIQIVNKPHKTTIIPPPYNPIPFPHHITPDNTLSLFQPVHIAKYRKSVVNAKLLSYKQHRQTFSYQFSRLTAIPQTYLQSPLPTMNDSQQRDQSQENSYTPSSSLQTYRKDVAMIANNLKYSINLPQSFKQDNFVQLYADWETLEFLAESVRKYNRTFLVNWGISLLRHTLSKCLHHTDILGFLNVGLMHIISANQLTQLLEHSYNVRKPVDVAALQRFNMKDFLSTNQHSLDGLVINGNFIGKSAEKVTSLRQFSTYQTDETIGTAGDYNTLLQTHNIASSILSPRKANSKAAIASSLLGVDHCDYDSEDDSGCGEYDSCGSCRKEKSHLDKISSLLSTDDNPPEFTIPEENTPLTRLHQQASQPLKKFGTMLDVGAGSGRMAEILSPIFEIIECTEVSEKMINLIQKKGFVAHYIDNIDHLPPNAKYDVICLFNLIDRCDEPITLLYQLHHRLKQVLSENHAGLLSKPPATIGTPENTTLPTDYYNPNGRIVIAVPLPLRPSVEMTLSGSNTSSWRAPKERIDPRDVCWCCTTWEESFQHLVVNIIEPCGYDVLTFSRLPYLSEGNENASHFVLEDVVLVLAPKYLSNQF